MGEFVLKEIDIDLTRESFNNAIEQVNNLKNNLVGALDALVKELLEKGKEVAEFQLSMYQSVKNADLRTGDLIGSIRVEMANGTSSEGYILAGYPGDSNGEYSYAVYFEFGYGTADVYTEDGKLLRSEEQVEKASSRNMISKVSGRKKNHPSGREVYRDMEDYNIITMDSGHEYHGWVYKDKRSGKFYTAHSQNPKPFMYKTLMSMTEKAEKEGPQYIVNYIASREV